MNTVSKEIADRIIAGEFPEDDCVQIVEYDNAWGGVSYGCCFGLENIHKYRASAYVRNPRVYWKAKGIWELDE